MSQEKSVDENTAISSKFADLTKNLHEIHHHFKKHEMNTEYKERAFKNLESENALLKGQIKALSKVVEEANAVKIKYESEKNKNATLIEKQNFLAILQNELSAKKNQLEKDIESEQKLRKIAEERASILESKTTAQDMKIAVLSNEITVSETDKRTLIVSIEKKTKSHELEIMMFNEELNKSKKLIQKLEQIKKLKERLEIEFKEEREKREHLELENRELVRLRDEVKKLESEMERLHSSAEQIRSANDREVQMYRDEIEKVLAELHESKSRYDYLLSNPPKCNKCKEPWQQLEFCRIQILQLQQDLSWKNNRISELEANLRRQSEVSSLNHNQISKMMWISEGRSLLEAQRKASAAQAPEEAQDSNYNNPSRLKAEQDLLEIVRSMCDESDPSSWNN